MIGLELEIPVMIIPKESSIFCAAGMLISDFKHDFVKTYATLLHEADSKKFKGFFADMKREGTELLKSEGIPEKKIEYVLSLDLRYVKQYHEVNVEITEEELDKAVYDAIATRFHHQHNSLYGYSLETEKTPVELINIRLVCIGRTEKPKFQQEEYDEVDPSSAYKKSRKIFLPMEKSFRDVDVFDGAGLRYGNKVPGPAIIEQVNTTTLVTSEYNVLVDKYGSYTMYLKTREEEIEKRILK
jgi:N-methylhydantoinase A